MHLAIRGGTPIRSKSYHAWPLQDEDVKTALSALFDRGEWGQSDSETLTGFERKFGWYHDAKHAVATVSSSVTLETALKALGVGPGDEVLVPAYCHAAIPLAVVASNAVPIFVDIRSESVDIDPESIDRRITERTKVIIVSHLAGSLANMDDVKVVARKYKLKVLEDCLEAAGAEFDNRKVGSIGDLGVFGFGDGQLLSAGQGGMIVSNNEALVNRCCALVREGEWPPQSGQKPFVMGTSASMTSLQAAVLTPQLDKLDDLNLLRADRCEALSRLLTSVPGITTLTSHRLVTRQALEGFPFRYDPARFNNAPRDRFVAALKGEGIRVSAGYGLAFENAKFRLHVESCPYRCRYYPFPYYLAKCPATEDAVKRTVVLDHLALLEEDDDLADFVKAIDKLSKLKHEI